jgi:glycosyltransferase involved in cell wall biosynthesis
VIIQSDQYIKNPLVSVFIITFNQEATIAQTIDSILMQEGNFKMELIIGEDASKDKTRDICISYQQKYPHQIKLLLQDTNQGLVKNYIDTQKLCTGYFIALCAGDDYWIDKKKLQKQLNFFDNNPEFGVVSTNGYKYYVKSNKHCFQTCLQSSAFTLAADMRLCICPTRPGPQRVSHAGNP